MDEMEMEQVGSTRQVFQGANMGKGHIFGAKRGALFCIFFH